MEKGFLGMRHAAQVMLLCALLGASGALSAAEVQGIRVATTETGTRVVLDLSAPVTSKAFRSQVMLLGALLGASGALSAAEVQGIRVATTETGTRVVLDLSAPVTSKAF